MKASDIPNQTILQYIVDNAPAARMADFRIDGSEIPGKVLDEKLERIYDRGWIDCGTSIWSPWITADGRTALKAMENAS